MGWIGRQAVRWRWIVVAVWIALAAFCALALPNINSVVDQNQGSFLPSSEPSVAAANLAEPFAPVSGTTGQLVIASDSGKLTPKDIAALAALERRIRGIDDVSAVRDQGLSGDGEAATALIVTPLSASSTDADQLVSRIRDAIGDARFSDAVDAELTGSLAVEVDTDEANADANDLTAALTTLIVLVMLFVVYRSLLAPIVTLMPALFSLAVSGGVIGACAQAGWFDVSSVTQALFTVLVIGAGTDYGIFLILRMREEMAAGHDSREATVRAVHRVGESIASSAGTVIGALLSLLLASFVLYADLGPALAIAIFITLVAALTLLPALTAILGHTLFWPRKVVAVREDGLWGRVAERVVSHPKAALLVGGVFFGALAACALGFSSAGFGGDDGGPKGSGSAEGSALIAAHYPAALVDPTGVVMRFDEPVWKDLERVAQAQRRLAAEPGFASVTGLTNPTGTPIPVADLEAAYAALGPPGKLPPVPPADSPVPLATYEVYRATAQFVSPDGRTVQYLTGLSAGDATTTAALDAVPQIRGEVTRVARSVGATESGVTGLAPISYDISQVSNDDLRTVLPVVMALIAVLLALVLRSLIAPLYLVASVVISYFASLGLAVVLFMWIGGSDGLNFVLPFLMFVFLMALGSDYNILVMSRIREEAHRLPLHRAIMKAVHVTGTTVTSAGLVLAATFAVVGVVSPASQVRQLGIAISLGVLLDTFFVRTLLVPSIVALLGRWNWWPSKLSRMPEPVDPPAPGPEPDPEPVREPAGTAS